MKTSGIYCITNTINEKCYVGSSIYIERRWRYHKGELQRNAHKNLHLQSAWNLYGGSSFVFSIIEECAIADLMEREQFWIDMLQAFETGYNQRPKAASCLGMIWTEERKIAHSLALQNPETLEKMRIAKTGVKLTAETKAKMSAAKVGRKLSLETRAKMSAIAKNRPNHNNLDPTARKGKPQPLEARRKISVALAARPPISDETRAKLCHAAQNRSPETIARMSEAARNRKKRAG